MTAINAKLPVTPDRIIDEARGWLGTPYRHQASTRGVGCDCLGLIRGVWRGVYGVEPEATPAYSADWAEAGRVENLAHAASRHMTAVPLAHTQPGDVLLFRWRSYVPAKHIAILTTHDHIIHAQDKVVVCEVALSNWWLRHRAYGFRFPERL